MILASALMVFTWNTLPIAAINFCGSLLLVFRMVLKNHTFSIDKLFFFFLASLLSFQVMSSGFLLTNTLGGGYFWFFIMGLLFLSKFSLSEIRLAYLGVIGSVFSVNAYDAYLRLAELLDTPFLHFHAYKFGNVGMDTNYSAAMIVMVYAITLISDKLIISEKQRRLLLITGLFLIILTFSRSAWIVTAILTGMYSTRRRPLVRVALSGILMPFIVSLVYLDESLLSKFNIISLAFENIGTWGIGSLFFGLGGNIEIDGVSLHLLILQVFYYSGALGMICFISLVLCLLKFRVIYSLTAYLLLGLSFVPFSSPLISLCFFLEYAINNNKRENKDNVLVKSFDFTAGMLKGSLTKGRKKQ